MAMDRAVIVLVLSVLVVAIIRGGGVQAKRGCASFGHSCYGGMGKRSELENTNEEALQNNIHQDAENPAYIFTAEYPAVLEPLGVSRSDGKRVDGMTLTPWKWGKELLWDATCSHTLATTYIDKTSKSAGQAAYIGEQKKHNKYRVLEGKYIFVPFAVETFGPWGDEAKKLISEISQKLPDKRARSFITQRIGMAIQRGNAASVLGTIKEESGPRNAPLNAGFPPRPFRYSRFTPEQYEEMNKFVREWIVNYLRKEETEKK